MVKPFVPSGILGLFEVSFVDASHTTWLLACTCVTGTLRSLWLWIRPRPFPRPRPQPFLDAVEFSSDYQKHMFHVIWVIANLYWSNNTSNKEDRVFVEICTLQSTISSVIFDREGSSMDTGDGESSSSRMLSNSDFRVFRTDFGYPHFCIQKETVIRAVLETAGRSKQNSSLPILLHSPSV